MQHGFTAVKAVSQSLGFIIIDPGDITSAEVLDQRVEGGAQSAVIPRRDIVKGHRDDGLAEAVRQRGIGGGAGDETLQSRGGLDLLPQRAVEVRHGLAAFEAVT